MKITCNPKGKTYRDYNIKRAHYSIDIGSLGEQKDWMIVKNEEAGMECPHTTKEIRMETNWMGTELIPVEHIIAPLAILVLNEGHCCGTSLCLWCAIDGVAKVLEKEGNTFVFLGERSSK